MGKWITLFLFALIGVSAHLEEPWDIYRKNWLLSEVIEFLENNKVGLEHAQFIISGLQEWEKDKLEVCPVFHEISDSDATNHTDQSGEITPPK